MKTLRTVGYVVLALAIAYFGLGLGIYYWKEYVRHPEPGALSSLRALYTMQANYKHDHGRYAESFEQLVPPREGAVTGGVLDWGEGYLYSLRLMRPDWSDEITGYVIIARPQKYRFRSKRSFWMDDGGTVRYTNEDRAPNNRDRVLATVPF